MENEAESWKRIARVYARENKKLRQEVYDLCSLFTETTLDDPMYREGSVSHTLVRDILRAILENWNNTERAETNFVELNGVWKFHK